MRHPALEAGHADRGQRPLDAAVDLGLGDAHVQRAERDVVEHRRAEQLVVGVLEHEPDLARTRRTVDRSTTVPPIRTVPWLGARGCR